MSEPAPQSEIHSRSSNSRRPALEPTRREALYQEATRAAFLGLLINVALGIAKFAGGVWGEPSDFDIADIRTSVGLGFGFNVPKLGPVRIDYGYRLNPDSTQGNGGKLHLTSGLRF